MKRDDEYIRQLLLDLEASEETDLVSTLLISSDEEQEKQYYHLQLLCDAALMKEVQTGVFRMTNQGHDFVSAIRSDTVWKKTKTGAGKLGGVSLEILRDIATAYIKDEVKKVLGISLP
ncbi:hypothetical protein ASG19_13935 [Rhizobium sp. Leaf306]|uniref:DUF2513 domain-containing protein n=1 Tax=Rhizobium sp. Leaf306 TaxID=1736330 RepID=UPI0007159EC7|nr:DUF2513 domain-containing protein [Rhizobium sp. Leaf306]KQQ34863.1 hypothetical protein ASG19_13935 [Rhizobium sp. Leaf306]